jgi:hypothetical protein
MRKPTSFFVSTLSIFVFLSLTSGKHLPLYVLSFSAFRIAS